VTRVAVARTKYARGFPSDKDVPFAYQVLELNEALERRYTSDAHLVTYVANGLVRQQRVNKPGLAAYPHPLRVECFFADVDNPGHALWTDETLAEARATDPHHEALATTGLYYTSAGRRIVQPLEKPVLAGEAEPYIRAWLVSLEQAGLAVDHNCRDWTRHFRLPYVRREGLKHTQIPDCLDLSRMRAVVPPEPTENVELAAIDQPGTRRPRDVHVGAWTTELPEVYRETAERLAVAVCTVSIDWHPLFMALAGALLARGIPPEHVPALCHAVSTLTGGDDRTQDRVTSAKTTVDRWRLGQPISGYSSLCTNWPGVAQAVDLVTSRGDQRRAREAAMAPVAPVALPALEVTIAALEDAIRNAGTGLTLIQAACGLGKTRATERIAAERAAKTHVSPDAMGDRAPFNSKTAISVDKHALAEQVVAHLVQLRTPARRHFGPLSKMDDKGQPVCKFAEIAGPLVAGGQRMRWLLCDGQGKTPCEYADTCAAKDGAEGPDDARVDVGPHGLMGQLDKATGSTGLLVLDEPPSLLETYSFTMAQLDEAVRHLRDFESNYVNALQPALQSLLQWARTWGPDDKPSSIQDLVNHFAGGLPPEIVPAARRAALLPDNADPLACARHAPRPDGGPRTPPIDLPALAQVRKSPARAAEVGRTSRLLQTVQHGAEHHVVARVETYNGRRVLHLTHVNDQFRDTLKRNGAVVVLDANADIHAPVFAKVAPLQFLRFDAPDGAPIERTMHWLPHATRTGWLKDGKLQLVPSLVRAVRSAIAWAHRKPGNGVLAIIAIRVVELALRAAFDPSDTVEAEWKEAGQDAATLADVHTKLGPILATWKGKLLVGHYGALRGLDHMAEADCLVTLGDPWVNKSQAEHEAVFLEVEDWNDRYRALCAAELEQAHGRLRTIHRTREGRALHLGTVAPGGQQWAVASAPRSTKAPDDAAMVSAVATLGSVSAAAAALHVRPANVRAALQRSLRM